MAKLYMKPKFTFVNPFWKNEVSLSFMLLLNKRKIDVQSTDVFYPYS